MSNGPKVDNILMRGGGVMGGGNLDRGPLLQPGVDPLLPGIGGVRNGFNSWPPGRAALVLHSSPGCFKPLPCLFRKD